jgi:hypothetical protein
LVEKYIAKLVPDAKVVYKAIPKDLGLIYISEKKDNMGEEIEKYFGG